MSSSPQKEPKLIHKSLLKLPMSMRFGLTGLLSNVLFMVGYNTAVAKWEDFYSPSFIYAIFYFFYIPVGHALSSLIAFGWPEKYVSNLLSNYPIGLTGIVLGSSLTAYLDYIGFNEGVENFIRTYITMIEHVATDEDEKGEFYTSLVVLIVTSVWCYVLSVMVNAPSEKTTTSVKEDKNALSKGEKEL